ncbi:MAG TPA: hypothetical protein VJ735_05960 [Actinomycetes bacterium]|nr:hypothetical protein [Actinomycetes bacterium]
MVLAALGCLFALLLAGRVNETAFDVDWQDLATPEGRRALYELRRRFALERGGINLALGRPLELAAAGDEAEAARLLVAGYVYMAGLAQDRQQLLRAMARYSRMVNALMPLPPVAAGAFRLRQLRSLAGLGAAAHHLLVTVPERFRLRVAVLRRGFWIVLRAIATRRPDTAPRWAVVVDALADWHSLDEETLESFRALVTAVALPSTAAAERRA